MAELKYQSAKAWASQPIEVEKKAQPQGEKRIAPKKRRRRVETPLVIKPAAFYVPTGLDLDIYPAQYKWPAAYFLNLIHWKTGVWQANEEGYVQLKYAYLRRVIPRQLCKPILAMLKGASTYPTVVEDDAKVIRGCKCLGYRITPGYRDTQRVVCTDDTINRKIARVYAKDDRATQKVHHWLRTKLSLLRFDMDKARSIIEKMKPKRGRKGASLPVKDYRRQRLEYCDRIHNGDHWFTCDRFGRVHTPITALERKLRCCLSVAGQQLVNIDLANSQPLILGLVARQYYKGRMAKSRFLSKTFAEKAGRQSPYCTREVRAMSKDGNVSVPEDLVRYVRVCEEGRFYESMMTAADEKRGKDRFKKRFYRVLFGRNGSRSHHRNALRAVFRQQYPSAAKVLRALKRKNYRHSAYVLQNYEATLFIDIICRRIMDEHPDTVLFTIHDSLLTTPDSVAYVESVILDEFGKLGVRPMLKKECYE
jgi:hypothetical protein